MSQSLLTRLAAIAVILITGLTLTSYIAWNSYLELASHFKLQYLVVSLLCILLLLIERRKKLLFIALFCISIQSIEIIPWYFPPFWIGRSETHDLRILLSNVYVRNRSYEKVLSLVSEEKPDIAIFQEVAPDWAQQLQALSSTFPYSFQIPNDQIIYSRFPLNRPALFGFVLKPSIAVNLTIDRQDITLVVTHPLPPLPSFFESRNQQLLDVGRYIQQQKNPVILMGDLNTTMWSPYYHKLIQDTGLENARNGFGLLPTWPVPNPYASTFLKRSPIASLFKIPIDHCLLNSLIKVTTIHSGPSVDSDHLPLIVDLAIPAKSA
ncbi:MAG: endonuclease/exonuclease/phosphatase family protein [Microcoleus sp. SU_5_6]|nr:endonuclease/exonuclease/phosphatase family protein [Microcoleus sp. SU_5_6]